MVTWTPPSVGKIASYNVYRCAGVGCTPVAPAFKNVTGGGSSPSFTDAVNDIADAGTTCPASSTCYNTTYVYAVTSQVLVNSATVESLFSKTVTGEIPHLFVLGNSATVVYGATIPAPAYTIYGDVSGSLSSGVSCVYSPSAPRNVGTYSVVCSGPASTSATDGVTYNAAYLTFTPGVLTITQRPITVPAGASNKVYDGTVSSPTTPIITSGSLAYSDTVTWIETYDNRNVGTTHVLTPSGTVSDGNGGNNYKVTFVPYSPGIITVRPITVSASASTKFYDGGVTSTAVPVITTGSLGSGDTAPWAETYDNKNVGSTHVMTPAGIVSDGNSGNNYSVMFVNINTGIINPAPASVTPNAASALYGTPDPPFTGTLAGFLPADGVTASYSRAPGSDAGMYTISATLSPAGVLGNYAITYNTAVFTILPLPQTIQFAPLQNPSLGTPDFMVSATATSGLPVTFTASGNCSLTPAGLIHLISDGNCTITASQAGGLDYLPAPNVSQSITIAGIDVTRLSLAGSPSVVSTVTSSSLTMTSSTSQTAAAWLPVKQPVANGFTTQFTFQLSSAAACSRMGSRSSSRTPRRAIGALGTTGLRRISRLSRLTNSLAIEFDTFQND